MQRVGETDDTAGEAATRVAGLEGLFIAALTQVVVLGVDDEGAAHTGVLTIDVDQLVLQLALNVAMLVSMHIAEVADVTDLLSWASVGLSMRVEVRSSSLASFGKVACTKI